MNIIQIVPGTGNNFYCENCFRDAVLARAWRKQQENILVVPLYLPLLSEITENNNTSEIFFGGVNVYLQQKLKLFRKTPRWLDWFFDRPGLLRWAGHRAGMTSARDLADTTLSMLCAEEGNQIKELERLVSHLAKGEKPDVVCLSNALLSGLARRIKEKVGVPVVCFLQDEDEFLDALPERDSRKAWEVLSQRASDVDMFVGVSEYYAKLMEQRLGLERVKVSPLGVSVVDFTPADEPPSVPTIGYLSRTCRDKGLDSLVEAFIQLKGGEQLSQLRLRVAGGRTLNDQPFIEAIRSRLANSGFGSDVEFLTEFSYDSRCDFYPSLTVLSVPERHGSAGGMYALEALASGVPVVQPASGAFPELQRQIGDGMSLVEPDNVEELASALEPLLIDKSRARQLGMNGREKVSEKFNIDNTSRDLINIFQQVAKKHV